MNGPQVMQGLPKLLRAVSASLANESGELTKELLQQSADRIEKLEAVANIALFVVGKVPTYSDRGNANAKVSRTILRNLCDRLNELPDYRVRRIK